jgi:hypothetical protein
MIKRLVLALIVLSVVGIAAAYLRPAKPFRFRDRAVEPVGNFESMFFRNATKTEAEQHAIFVNRTLLIRTPSVVDHPEWLDPDPTRFTFKCVLAAAFGLDCKKGADVAATALRGWIDTGDLAYFELNRNWKDFDPNRSIDSIPLIPLAVVNRLDVASIGCQPDGNCSRPVDPAGRPCSDNSICGAEFRFVYAGVPYNQADGHYFALILEFTLPPLSKTDYIALAQQWANLANVADDPDHPSQTFAKAVGGVLSYCFKMPGILARIRANGLKDGNWNLSQVVPSGDRLTAQYLFQQPSTFFHPDTDCQEKRKSDLADFVAGNINSIVYPALQPPVPVSKYAFDALPKVRAGGYPMDPSGKEVLTFADNITASPDLTELLRHTVSLNTCLNCHGLETKTSIGGPTPFDQIRYRLKGQQSTLAPFLTGDGSSGEPTLNSYTVSAPVIKDGGCTASGKYDYTYNDLKRRAKYLQALLPLNPADDDKKWYAALLNLGTVAID